MGLLKRPGMMMGMGRQSSPAAPGLTIVFGTEEFDDFTMPKGTSVHFEEFDDFT